MGNTLGNRAVICESDSRYFPWVYTAIRSFILHNPGWDIYVCNLGLNAGQLSKLQGIGASIFGQSGESLEGLGRFIQARTRLQGIHTLLSPPYSYQHVCQLDGDTLTLGSVEPAYTAFVKAPTNKAAFAPDAADMHFHIDVKGDKFFSSFLAQHGKKRCLMMGMVFFSQQSLDLIRQAYSLLARCVEHLRYKEQSAISVTVYSQELPFLHLGRQYNAAFHFGEPVRVVSDREVYLGKVKEPVVVLHYAGGAKGKGGATQTLWHTWRDRLSN